MAKKSSNKKSRETWSFNKILNFCAYIATACIAIALILATIFSGKAALYSSFKAVGEAIAYAVTIVLAGLWVKNKRNIWWLVSYIVFAVVIVVLYFINLF